MRGRRRVAFSFAADEPGARFRCKLDRKPFPPCRSPRAYTVGLGPHALRVFAIDAAGNRDPTPARFSFRVRRPALAAAGAEAARRRGRSRPARSASTGSANAIGAITSWAIRSPGSTRKVSAGSVLSSRTRTSPR